MKKFTTLFLLSALALASLPYVANAQITADTAQEGTFQFVPLELGSFPLIGPALRNGSIDFSALVNSGYKLILAILAMITVGSIVFYGIQYMVTGGIEIKKNALKHATNAFYGLLLLVFAFILLNTINPELVKPGALLYNATVRGNAAINAPTSNNRVINTNQASWQTGSSCETKNMVEADPTQCPGNPTGNNLCCSPQ